MKKTVKAGLIIISLLLVAVMLCSCGESAYKETSDPNEYAFTDEAADASADAEAKNSLGASKNSSEPDGTADQSSQSRKIIEYHDLTVETKSFDKLIDDINDAVKKAGGYIENSKIDGNSYYGADNRTAELKVRIPQKKQSDFNDFITKNSNVVNRSVSSEDVTARYIDTQSRIKALTLEKETLENLLTKSANMTDTLTVYERLTDVIAEIESYQGRLNQMDNLIEYTTFTISVCEVEKETNVEKQNWFEKTWNGLLNNLSDVGNGLLGFISFLLMALPYWILLGIVAGVVILIIRRQKRKKTGKTQSDSK